MIYKCEACGGVLVYDPDLGKMKCTQCGQTSERRFHMKLKEVDPDTEEKEDGKRSFDNLWFGLDKDQKWHGEKEILIGMRICWHLRCGITDRKIYRLHQNRRKQRKWQEKQSSRYKMLLMQMTGKGHRGND